MPDMLLYRGYCHTEVHAWEERGGWRKTFYHYYSFDIGGSSIDQEKHYMKCGIVMISGDLRVLHRPQSFINILDGWDPSWVMSLLPSGFWGETQFPAFSPSAHKHCSAHQAQVNLPFLQGMMSKSKSGWYLSTNNWGQFWASSRSAHRGETRWPRPASHARGRPQAQACCPAAPPLLHHSLPITGFAVDLRRSWSYYAIFVFFLWYCPGLLIPGCAETVHRNGCEERRQWGSGSKLAESRSLPSGSMRSPDPNCHRFAECLPSLSDQP